MQIFTINLWPPVEKWFDEITSIIAEQHKVLESKDLTFDNDYDFETFIKGVYKCDDIADRKVQKKIYYMREYDKKIRNLCIEVKEPNFRKKQKTGNDLSTTMEKLKKRIRNSYKNQITNYLLGMFRDNDWFLDYIKKNLHKDK